MQSTVPFTIIDAEVQWQVTSARIEEWMTTEVFHFRWWFLLAVLCLSVYLWWKMVDKSRLNEIVLNMVFIIIAVIVLDELGDELTLWDYPTDLIPLFPPLTGIDLATMPMIYSLIYQHFRTWKSFLIASTIMALAFCFILEPLSVYIGVYQTLTWRYYYGLPIYFAIGVIGKLLVGKIYSISSSTGA
ncbi:MAG: hypothetical protein HPY50_10540 [Firmicutes bacterium]|nr:hypothetical protein [Bacillota bacterium]